MDRGDAAGGSGALARLIDRHGEEILSDFLHYYRTDLADVLRPGSGLTARRALALVRQLPPESATVAAMRGGAQFRGWAIDRYLLAQLVDSVNQNTYAFVAANSKRKPKPPKPIERPSAASADRRKLGGFAALAAARIKAVREMKKRGGDG